MVEARASEGGCCCGAIRYRVAGPCIWSAGCCCRDCVRAVGAPFMVWTGFAPERVEFLRGRPKVCRSSVGVLRGFCPDCGTTLTYGREPGYEGIEPTLYVATATLDRPEEYPPEEVVWHGQRPSWLVLGDGMPLHDTTSPANAGRALINATPKS